MIVYKKQDWIITHDIDDRIRVFHCGRLAVKGPGPGHYRRPGLVEGANLPKDVLATYTFLVEMTR